MKIIIINQKNKMEKVKLSIAEIIDRVRDGRTQTSIVNKMNTILENKITEVQFSRKKNGNDNFTPEEFTALNEILGTDFK